MFAHKEFDDYHIVVKANDASEAESLANDWFCGNISSVDNPDIN